MITLVTALCSEGEPIISEKIHLVNAKFFFASLYVFVLAYVYIIVYSRAHKT